MNLETGTVFMGASFVVILLGACSTFFRMRATVQELERRFEEHLKDYRATAAGMDSMASRLMRIETLLELLVKRSGMEDAQEHVKR
jgi:hypothetical protein